ncbi:MAG: heme biosynthesis protein HemY [Methylococcaceae bacterium]|nr:heme biosynthesis protein HemY [Methylococcaceae bacterium]
MKKNIIYFLGLPIIALIAAYFVHDALTKYDNPGYVLMGIGHWALETTVVFFVVAQIIGFFILYVLFRLLGLLLRLPSKMMTSRETKKADRSQNALISGLVDSAAGNWEQAEKVLIRHASNSGAPLLHYLTAARAAQSRGAIDKRDEYLKKAADQGGEGDLAVGLTQAELHLSENQFEDAVKTLTKLNSIDPTQASVLKLLHQTYQNIGDWEAIRKLIPSLHKNKVLMEVEVKLLETETYSRLLKQSAEKADASETRQLWETIPPHIQKITEIRTIYFAAMIAAEAGAEIQEEVVAAISENWNETLLVVFGNIQSKNYVNQLLTAEKWIASHPENPVLLRMLGKISLKCDQPEKAEDYLSKSLTLEPTVAAYQLLGDLFYDKNDKDKASECYKYGLELASSEIVQNVENIAG